MPRKSKGKFHVLVDSDAFVGWTFPDDAHHERTTELFQKLAAKRIRLVTTDYVVAETATVLSHISGQALARQFLDVIERIRFPVIHITRELHRETLDVFKQQNKKGTSATDCANVCVIRRYGIQRILSFDGVYGKAFSLDYVA